LSSADRGVQIRTSALFGTKYYEFFEIYGVSARTDGGVNFSRIFADIFYGRAQTVKVYEAGQKRIKRKTHRQKVQKEPRKDCNVQLPWNVQVEENGEVLIAQLALVKLKNSKSFIIANSQLNKS